MEYLSILSFVSSIKMFFVVNVWFYIKMFVFIVKMLMFD